MRDHRSIGRRVEARWLTSPVGSDVWCSPVKFMTTTVRRPESASALEGLARAYSSAG